MPCRANKVIRFLFELILIQTIHYYFKDQDEIVEPFLKYALVSFNLLSFVIIFI